jgi:hypothetical protein
MTAATRAQAVKPRIPPISRWTNHPVSLVRLASKASGFPILSVRALVAAAGLWRALAGPGQAALVGHWTFDNPANPWEESSGYRPAGTHDGVPIGGAVWSAERHAGSHTGGSLDLTAGYRALVVTNTLSTDPGYRPTFDDVLANGMTIACWARGFPDAWGPWVSKNGEAFGYQVRRYGSENYATFTIRGTASGSDDPCCGTVNSQVSGGSSWHHYAAVWDGINGTRQLYVDGVLSISITGDYGPFAPADRYLVFGARDWDGGSGGSLYAWTKCKLDDIRVYDTPLTADEVQALAAQEAGTIILAPQSLETFPGRKISFTVALVPQALQTNGVTVWITNSNPGSLTLPGTVGNVWQLTFPQGSTNVQNFQAVCTAPGTANLTCSTSDGALANSATVQIDTALPPALVAHWTFDDPGNPYAETSGYRPAGTHDGQPQNSVATSTDIPPGTTGYSVDLTQGSLRIANSMSGDAGYQPTFDQVLVGQMTIAFWVKINQIASDWGPFVIKNGEGPGFQVRLNASSSQSCFTLRGLDSPGDDAGGVNLNDGQWHHLAAVHDGATGLRLLYVDGYPDQPSVRPTSDTGLMDLPSGNPLFLGTGDNGRQFSGYLKDVRIYDYALTRAQIQALIPNVPTPMVGHWTFDTSAPLAETSGYQPAGTHDLLPAGTVSFSADVPPGRTGQSLDLTAGNSAVVVSNSNQQLGGGGGGEPWTPNPTWQNTFDLGLSVQMSIAFWAKGFPNAGNPWVSKKGTDYGYQVARSGSGNFATFTQTGTPGLDSPAGTMINVNDNAWHHYAAVWDGIAGTRQLYVDGTLDPGVNLTGDYGPSSNVASFEYLVFGGRDLGGLGSFTPCRLNDMRIYRLALSQAEVLALLPAGPPPKLAGRSSGASGLRISWPVASFGYRLQTSASLTGVWSDAGLTVTVEGNDRVAYAPVSARAQFFRLVK